MMLCNKILGKVTDYGGIRTKTLGAASRFMVGGGGAHCAPLGLYRVNITYTEIHVLHVMNVIIPFYVTIFSNNMMHNLIQSYIPIFLT